MTRQKCTKCDLPSLPGLYRGSGHCAYHWAAKIWGEAWAAHCHPDHPEARRYIRQMSAPNWGVPQ